jgi:hypothetical protein
MTFNLRVFLWAALIAALFMNFEMWQHDYPPAASPASARRNGCTARPQRSHGRCTGGPPPRRRILNSTAARHPCGRGANERHGWKANPRPRSPPGACAS